MEAGLPPGGISWLEVTSDTALRLPYCLFDAGSLKKSVMTTDAGLHAYKTYTVWQTHQLLSYLVILFHFGAQGEGERKWGEKIGGSSW